MIALIAIGKDFSSALRNLFDSLISMKEASNKNGKKFEAWFIRVTCDTEKEGVWLEAKHTENILPMRWGRYEPLMRYHLFINEECVCSPQKKSEDVSNWLRDEDPNDAGLCVKCYRTMSGG